MADACTRWNYSKIIERFLSPSQKFISFNISFVLSKNWNNDVAGFENYQQSSLRSCIFPKNSHLRIKYFSRTFTKISNMPFFVTCLTTSLFEGVCVNYRHPGPRRGEPRVGSGPDVAFPLDPVDPAQNSVRLIFIVKNNVFLQFCRKMIAIFGGLSS